MKTPIEIINRDYNFFKNRMTPRYLKKYFEQADLLINPKDNEIVEYRANCIITKESGKYFVNFLGDTDLKKWRLISGWKKEILKQELVYNID